ncbi:MAG: glycerol-3-phosphate acyltransferase, partial [Bacteroidota bacterium]|nr:glycerol-3-phosphate acyltransferase [Bacteroidota bacterium]
PVGAILLSLEGDAQSTVPVTCAAAALLGAVAGHNFSPWIGWKGGRGLATAAGGALVLNPAFVAIWGLFWLAGFFKARRVHFANIAATLLLPFTVLIALQVVSRVTAFADPGGRITVLTAFLMSLLVLLRHIEPLKDILNSYRKSEE